MMLGFVIVRRATEMQEQGVEALEIHRATRWRARYDYPQNLPDGMSRGFFVGCDRFA